MWGLDATDPAIAIQAMQAMNASVRNGVFAPAFFGTPFALIITALLLRKQNHNTAAKLFTLSAIINLTLGVILTMAINVPMNQALAIINIPNDPAVAEQIWLNYSPKWQFWNQIRTITTGIALLIAIWGTLHAPILKTRT